MKINYSAAGVALFLYLIGINNSSAQSSGPVFLDCHSEPASLCITDEGVRLPANNKIYLGEENPDASSCSVHVTQKTRIRSTCGKSLQYETLLFLNSDTSAPLILTPL